MLISSKGYHIPCSQPLSRHLNPILTIRIPIANIVTITTLGNLKLLQLNDFHSINEVAEAIVVRSSLGDDDYLQAAERRLLMI